MAPDKFKFGTAHPAHSAHSSTSGQDNCPRLCEWWPCDKKLDSLLHVTVHSCWLKSWYAFISVETLGEKIYLTSCKLLSQSAAGTATLRNPCDSRKLLGQLATGVAA
jgi:hypothetical protein